MIISNENDPRESVLLHLRSFCKKFVCAYHTLARIKVVHLRSVLVLHLRLYIHSFSLATASI